MKDNWFKEISGRCPWNTNICGQDYCKAVQKPTGLNMQCRKNNCAPFFMVATIISAYKDKEENKCKNNGF